jgi:hypothetical protein
MYKTVKVITVIISFFVLMVFGLYAQEAFRPCPDPNGNSDIFRLDRSVSSSATGRVIVDELAIRFKPNTPRDAITGALCVVHADIEMDEGDLLGSGDLSLVVLRRTWTLHGLLAVRATLLSNPLVESVGFNTSDGKLQ